MVDGGVFVRGSGISERRPSHDFAAVLVACRFKRGKVSVSQELEVLQVNAVRKNNPACEVQQKNAQDNAMK